jgi:hypothetical protein
LVSFLSLELNVNFGQVKMTIGNIDGKAIDILAVGFLALILSTVANSI